MRNLIGKKRGFTLVELMIVVAIVGVLAALAIYGVRKYVLNAKTAEARNTLGQISKDASTAFSRESMAGTVLALGSTAAKSNQLCRSAAATVPAAVATVKGQKYQSLPSEWNATDTNTGWACLRFSMQDPQYYAYGYELTGDGSTAGDDFDITAEGDLDGDSSTSTFTFAGTLALDGASNDLVVTLAPNITEVNADE